jgi:MFS family permease
MTLYAFLQQNLRLVAFGFFLCFISSAGQTFFISLFNGELRAAFQLSHGEIGSMYAAGTIASAFTLMLAGRLVDRFDLRIVTIIVLAGLAAAAGLMGLVWTAALLPVVFFGLRLFGQGLASHTGMTAMGRYFDETRGRAISLASLGFAAGEAVLPSVIVAGLSVLAWRQMWFAIAAAVACTIPLTLALLAARLPASGPVSVAGKGGITPRQWRLGEVLRHTGLWLRLPTLLTPAFVITGIFFHQVHLAGEKQWPIALMAASFTVFAATSFATTFLAGPLFDRWTARRMLPIVVLLLAVSCVIIAWFAERAAAPAFMTFIGLTTGMYGTAGTAIWPELYGTRHLGAIKAFGQAVMVLASGVSPVLFGLLIDLGLGFGAIAAGCAALCIVAAGLAALANRWS